MSSTTSWCAAQPFLPSGFGPLFCFTFGVSGCFFCVVSLPHSLLCHWDLNRSPDYSHSVHIGSARPYGRCLTAGTVPPQDCSIWLLSNTAPPPGHTAVPCRGYGYQRIHFYLPGCRKHRTSSSSLPFCPPYNILLSIPPLNLPIYKAENHTRFFININQTLNLFYKKNSTYIFSHCRCGYNIIYII